MDVPEEVRVELEKLTDFQRGMFWSEALKTLIGGREYSRRARRCFASTGSKPPNGNGTDQETLYFANM